MRSKRAIQLEIGRIKQEMKLAQQDNKPKLQGALRALRWVLSKVEPRPSEIYAERGLL